MTEKLINENHDANEQIMCTNHEELSARLVDYNIEYQATMQQVQYEIQ